MTHTPPDASNRSRRVRGRTWLRPQLVIPATVVLVLGLIGAGLAFQPWTLFVDDTTGTARILRLQNLLTSNGPDLKV